MLGKNKAKGLSIIIVGCGRVGTTLVEQLSAEGHDITIVDKDRDVVTELTNLYDIMGVVGNGASFTTQIDAGIKTADLIIAVTASDELNLLCCTVARRVSECAAIARVRDPGYSLEIAYLQEKLGLVMIINPEQEASREIARILSLPNALEVNTFSNGRVDLVKFRVPANNMIAGMTVAQIGARTENVLLCGVERHNQISIPSGNTEINAGDIVSFVAPRKYARSFFKSIGLKTNSVKNTMIVGGGDSAYYLSRNLLAAGVDVKIIEKDRARCEELTNLLPKAVIIHVSHESTKVVTKINRLTFNDVIDRLDLGSVIYPRYITAEAIIAYVRAKSASRGSNIETLYHMFNQRVEAIEFKIDKDSKVTNKPLSELNIKKNVLISFINRHGKIIIPSGQDCIKPGDTVMIVTKIVGMVDIGEILD